MNICLGVCVCVFLRCLRGSFILLAFSDFADQTQSCTYCYTLMLELLLIYVFVDLVGWVNTHN